MSKFERLRGRVSVFISVFISVCEHLNEEIFVSERMTASACAAQEVPGRNSMRWADPGPPGTCGWRVSGGQTWQVVLLKSPRLNIKKASSWHNQRWLTQGRCKHRGSPRRRSTARPCRHLAGASTHSLPGCEQKVKNQKKIPCRLCNFKHN